MIFATITIWKQQNFVTVLKVFFGHLHCFEINLADLSYFLGVTKMGKNSTNFKRNCIGFKKVTDVVENIESPFNS